MKKITMIIVLLMMTTMNLMATATSIRFEKEVGASDAVTEVSLNAVIGDTVGFIKGTPSDELYHISRYNRKGSKGFMVYIDVDQSTGEVTLNTDMANVLNGGVPILAGDIFKLRLEVYEADESEIQIGSTKNDFFSLTVTSIAKPVFSETTFETLTNPLGTVDISELTFDEDSGTSIVITENASGSNSANNPHFEVSGSTLRVVGPEPFESATVVVEDGKYLYDVIATNDEGGSTEQTLTIYVGTIVPTIAETTITGIFTDATGVIGTLVGVSNSAVTFTEDLIGSAEFDVASNGDISVHPLATLTAQTYIFNVVAIDGDGDDATIAISIEVSAIPSAPVFDGAKLSHPINENAKNGDEVVDLDDILTSGTAPITWTIEANDEFEILDGTTGVLTVKDSSTFDADAGPQSFLFDVTATDTNTQGTTQEITVVINDVEEVTVTDNQPFSIRNNALSGATVGQVEYTKEDAVDADIEFRLINPNSNSQKAFAISNTGLITVDDQDDFNALSDGVNNVKIEILNNKSGEKAQGDLLVTLYTPANLINDHDIGTLSEYTAQGVTSLSLAAAETTFEVAENDYFTISSEGVLTLIKDLDYDVSTGGQTSHALTVTATKDGDGDTAIITVLVGDEPDTGTVTGVVAATRSVFENATTGNTVSPAVVADATFPNQAEFTTESTDFGIGLTSGVLVVSPTADLDYETNASHSIDVVITVTDPLSDSENASVDVTITIDITDVEEDGKPSIEPQTFQIIEGEFVTGDDTGYTVAASGDNLRYTNGSVVAKTSTAFLVDTDNGDISVRDPADIVTGETLTFLVTVENTVTSETDSALITFEVITEPVEFTSKKKSKSSFEKATGCVIADMTPASLGTLFGLMAMVLMVACRKQKITKA